MLLVVELTKIECFGINGFIVACSAGHALGRDWSSHLKRISVVEIERLEDG
jgi:hypothetical protein